MSRGLAAFVAGMGGGYLKADRQRQEDERTDKLDKMREEEFSMRKTQAAQQDEIYQAGRTEREQKAALDKAIVDVNSAGKIDNTMAAVTSTDAAGQPTAFAQPDRQTADFALQQQALEAGLSPAAPTAPVQDASSVRTLDGGRKLFTGMDSAAKASEWSASNPNTSYAKAMALHEKLSSLPGGQERADQFFQRAKMMQKEGVNTALALLDAGDSEGAMKAFNSVGSIKLPEGAKFVGKEGLDPLTRAKKTIYSAIDADGKVLVKDVHQAAYNHLLDFKDRATIEASLTKADESAEARRYAVDGAFQRGMMFGGGAKTPGAGGGGGTGGTAKAAKDPVAEGRKNITDLVESIATKGEMKLQPIQMVDANQYAQQVYAQAPRDKNNLPMMPEALAAAVGIRVALKPEALVPKINPDTGLIDRVFDDDSTGETFTLRAGVGNAKAPNVPKDFDMGKAVTGMLGKLEAQSPGAAKMYTLAAFDKTGANGTSNARRELEQKELADLRERLSKEIPGFLEAPKDKQEATYAAASKVLMNSITNRLDMVAMHTKKPSETKSTGFGGGLFGGSTTTAPYQPPPDSPAARVMSRRADAERSAQARQATRQQEDQELSKQYRADKANMPAIELARKYDPLRGRLSTTDAGDLQSVERAIR